MKNRGQWITQQRLNPNQSVPTLIPLYGKYRPQLIELTSFKPKLLILSTGVYISHKVVSCQNQLGSIFQNKQTRQDIMTQENQ